ncbi:hypothetical protein M0R19_03775 [Candidatus Pacearchaeota archaeon]|nr:hypothetical protein [Candidatus Pacearchaeota archaeon]
MILTGKMYAYKQSKNYVYFCLEIDKNWFITNILPDLPRHCFDCFNTDKNNCLFLYFCSYKKFNCFQKKSNCFKEMVCSKKSKN